MNHTKIKKVAVLGAGVMGAQIAAHFVNAGIPVVLFDLPASKGDANSLINSAIKGLNKLKPPPLAKQSNGHAIQAANYEHDLAQLSTCDLVIEAISERLDWKKELFNKIEPYLNQTCTIATNTSGLSIQSLAECLPDNLQKRFLGMHFFNPPRYMRLVELIAHQNTSAELMDDMEAFLVATMGKGVVRAKDSPNFIGNRIGVFALLSVIQYAEEFNIPPDVVDALTGTLIGRPKSATFRTIDVVGLDTMQYVINTLKEGLKDDPWADRFELPTWLQDLIHKGHLGQKTKKGIYCKKGKDILVIDRKEGGYRVSKPQIAPELQAVLRKPDTNWLEKLKETNHPQAQFLWSVFRDIFHYSAYHLESIADTARDVDLAMRWGYGWDKGPFEIWQAAGWSNIVTLLETSSIPIPAWVKNLPQGPYQQDGSISPSSREFKLRSNLPVYQSHWVPEQLLETPAPTKHIVYEESDIVMWCTDQAPTIPILSFKTKQNTITNAVLDGIVECVKRAEIDYEGLVLWQGLEQPFSYGANLKDALGAMLKGEFSTIEQTVEKFQNAALSIHYSAVPVVAAVQGLALGGGCELAMHSARIVAAHETYIGLVEVGVGILPAGAGSKEFAKRAAHYAKGGNIEPYLTRYYEQIMMAQVSSSAADAKERDFLREADEIVMNPAALLSKAVAAAQCMSAQGYQAPLKLPFPVAGKDVQANFQTQLINMREGGFISDHDYLIGTKVAHILTGGGVAAGTLVTEDWLLAKEREMFMDLVKTKPTQQRMQHLLETGKPLRN